MSFVDTNILVYGALGIGGRLEPAWQSQKAHVMGGMHLWFTDRFGTDDANALAGSLRLHLDVDKPQFIVRRGDQELQQYIQLLGGWETWVAAFGIFAAAFLAKLGQRAADGFWDTVRDRLRGNQAKPLADVAEALAAASRAGGTSPQIVIGLDIPDNYFGTALAIGGTRPEEIAYAIARLVNMAEKISSSMKEEIAAGCGPLGRATITLLEDRGVTIRWMTHDFKERELTMHGLSD